MLLVVLVGVYRGIGVQFHLSYILLLGYMTFMSLSLVFVVGRCVYTSGRQFLPTLKNARRFGQPVFATRIPSWSEPEY
jgi:hypothetical protein